MNNIVNTTYKVVCLFIITSIGNVAYSTNYDDIYVNFNTQTIVNVLVLGDSISAGYGMNKEQGWVSLMQQHAGAIAEIVYKENGSPKEIKQFAAIRVFNASISGDTTSGGLSRLPSLLEEIQPTITFIELGGNDALRGQPLELIQANLMQLIQLTKEAHSKPILLGMMIPPNYGLRYAENFNKIFKDVAAVTDTLLHPFFLDNVAEHEELMQQDGIHPNLQAQPTLLANALPLLEKALEEIGLGNCVGPLQLKENIAKIIINDCIAEHKQPDLIDIEQR